jgi:hypothetical protein
VTTKNETAFTPAIGRPFKENMLTKLRSDTLSVVDLDQVTASPNLIRHDVPLEDVTKVGRTCKWRATLEAERRYCGNAGEVLNNKAVERTDRDKLAFMLDPRTLISLSKCGVAKVERGLLLSVLKEEYVKYGSRAQLYQQERKAAVTDTEEKAIESEKKTLDTLGLILSRMRNVLYMGRPVMRVEMTSSWDRSLMSLTNDTKLHIRPCSGRNSFRSCHGPRTKSNFRSAFAMWTWVTS